MQCMRVKTSSVPTNTDRRTQALKGALDLCVLSVLSSGATYGYDLVERLKERGLALVADGSVYPLLTRLEKRGLLTSERVASAEGPPRKYYSVTQDGVDALNVGRAEWLAVIGEITDALGAQESAT